MKATFRIIDILGAGIGLALLGPLLIGLAVSIRLYDNRPVFYRARRVGREGREFRLLKFRTMVPDADQIGGGLTLTDDHRITGIGKVLRRYKLDELPQLWNVLKGEMSLVGPRPEDPRYVAMYGPSERRILNYAPGITSPASLEYRNEEALLSGPDWQDKYLTQLLPRKLALDLDYLQERSVIGDLRLIGKTIVRIAL